MRALHIFAAVVLALEMPVPIYWLVLHSRVDFWRRHVRTSYWVAVLAAWGVGDWLLYAFRAKLFRVPQPVTGILDFCAIVAGLGLIAIDIYTLSNVEIELGGRRLVGH